MEFVFTEYFQLETDKGYSFPQKIREINTSNTVSRFHEIFLRYAHVIPILAFRSSLQLAIEPILQNFSLAQTNTHFIAQKSPFWVKIMDSS